MLWQCDQEENKQGKDYEMFTIFFSFLTLLWKNWAGISPGFNHISIVTFSDWFQQVNLSLQAFFDAFYLFTFLFLELFCWIQSILGTVNFLPDSQVARPSNIDIRITWLYLIKINPLPRPGHCLRFLINSQFFQFTVNDN